MMEYATGFSVNWKLDSNLETDRENTHTRIFHGNTKPALQKQVSNPLTVCFPILILSNNKHFIKVDVLFVPNDKCTVIYVLKVYFTLAEYYIVCRRRAAMVGQPLFAYLYVVTNLEGHGRPLLY